MQVRTQNRGRRQNIFDSFFGSYENYEYSFANSPVKIKVNPLPTSNRPADFNGMIGDLNLNVSLDTTATETGEPITMKIRISGEGNIKKLPEPKLSFPPDFEVYDPVVSEQVSRHQGKLGGRRTYEYLLVPRNPGTYDLPKVAFSYFDVGKKRYEQLAGPDFQVQVSGEPIGGFSGAGSGMSKEDMELIGQNIRHIHTSPSTLKIKGDSPLQKGWFWLLYLLPFVAMGGLVWYQNKQTKEASDVIGTKAKRATKVAKKRLSNAHALLSQGNEKGFYDEMTRALWGYLGDRFRLGQSDLTREQVSRVLQERGVEDALIAQLTEVLDTCEMALFAPVPTQGGAQGVYEKGVAFITEAEASINKA
ncbi:MAG: BatD family protein [Bacteroidota bacterium]